MDFKAIPIQKMLLIIFVLVISMVIGWYGERAVESFMTSNKVQSI